MFLSRLNDTKIGGSDQVASELITSKADTMTSLFADIWRSFLNLPSWVQIWMFLVLGPVNMATLAFLSQPSGMLVAALAVGGLAISLTALIADRGFTKLVSAGHVVTWAPLVVILVFARPGATATYDTFLTILLAANIFSLIFDFNDLRLWYKGDRAVFTKT